MFNRTREIVRISARNWEKYFCRAWRKLAIFLNPTNDPVLLVTLDRDKKGNIVLGEDVSGSLPGNVEDKLGLVVRDMVKGSLIAKKGPLPTRNPALVVLLPLPRFVLGSSLEELKSLAKDYRGEVLVGDVPYSYLTILI